MKFSLPHRLPEGKNGKRSTEYPENRLPLSEALRNQEQYLLLHRLRIPGFDIIEFYPFQYLNCCLISGRINSGKIERIVYVQVDVE
jgi:hypothetical protein